MYQPNFYFRIISLRNSWASVPLKKSLYAKVFNSKSRKGSIVFSKSLTMKTNEGLELKISKNNQKEIKVWDGMNVEEIANAFGCKKELISQLCTDVNKKFYQKDISYLANRFKKNCVFVNNPPSNIKIKQEENSRINSIESILVKRPPIVTIMGHVDHGKTTLLDSLRNSFIVKSEFGGITQHIGAFSVEVKAGSKITFIDTPGHAAFSAMRARGAQVTDIVVLVIAADDGIMAQTIESIKIINRAHVKMIVAVNKIDKKNALSIDIIKDRLLFEGIQVEDKGGNIQIVPISALKKINLDILVEMILLEADLMDLKANPNSLVTGVVIESKITNKGIMATLIVKDGTLKIRQILVGGTTMARVRSMFDENGNECKEAPPSTPVQVLGWKSLPVAGDNVFEVTSEKEASQIIKKRKYSEMMKIQEKDRDIILEKSRLHQEEHNKKRTLFKSLKTKADKKKFFKEQKELEIKKHNKNIELVPSLKLILKGDVHGSIEVLMEILNTYDKNDECNLCIIEACVGNISESDIELSQLFNAVIYGFNVNLHNNIKELAKNENIDIRIHNVLYTLIDDIKSELSTRIPPKNFDKILGEAIVTKNFFISVGKKKIPVAGCKCIKGELSKSALYKVIRNGEQIYEGKLTSIRHYKNEVNTVSKDSECGLMFESFIGEFQFSDSVICYEIQQIPQETTWNPGF